VMEKQRTNNGPLKESADKHSIYTLIPRGLGASVFTLLWSGSAVAQWCLNFLDAGLQE